MMAKNAHFIGFLLIAAGLQACAFPAQRKGNQPVDYYEEGMTDLARELYPEAMHAFATLKTKFPYSKYAALAELRLADVKFKSDRYLEAIDAYKLFVQYHPTHEEVPYAIYRGALAHYKEMPDEVFIFPPTYEKDQTEVERAAQAFREYLERYPSGKEAKDARRYLAECTTRLVAHDLYVARFYFKREKWRGAAGRYAHILGEYPGAKEESAVLLELAQTYVKLHEVDKARATVAQLVERYPRSAEASFARQALSIPAKGEAKEPPASRPAPPL